MINEIPEEKPCPKCQIVKKSNEFYVNKSRLDGLTYLCKVCIRNGISDTESKTKAARTKIAGTTKQCCGCKRTLNAACFTYSQHEPDKLRPACRVCCMWKGDGYPSPRECSNMEQYLNNIYKNALTSMGCTSLPASRRAEFEHLVYWYMVKYNLTEEWNPPIWIHKTSILET